MGKSVITRIRARLYLKLHNVCHHMEHAFHMAYLGFVSFEGHGYYRYAAGSLFVIVLVSFFIGDGSEAVEAMEEM